jgi:Bacterial PH domain
MGSSHNPDDYLLPTERRVIRVRRHWAVVAWDVFEAAALLTVVIILSTLLSDGAWLFQNILWYAGLLVVARFAYTLYAWWDEQLVVTDKRFVLITGVLTTRVAMMPLSKVTDLTYERSWPAGSSVTAPSWWSPPVRSRRSTGSTICRDRSRSTTPSPNSSSGTSRPSPNVSP